MFPRGVASGIVNRAQRRVQARKSSGVTSGRAQRSPEATTASAAEPEALGRVRRAARKRVAADAELERAVVDARAAGVSWAELASALGRSRSAVSERYGTERGRVT